MGTDVGEVMIHYTNYPLQTGATLFTLLHSPSLTSSSSYPALPPPIEPVWTYSKSEDPDLATREGAWTEVDYVVTEDWKGYESWTGDGGEKWRVVGGVEGLEGVRRGGRWGIKVRWGRKVAVLGRANNG